MSTWKEDFDNTVRRYEMSKDHNVHHNFTALYIELGRIAQRYIDNGDMWPDEKYDVPLEDGSTLRIQFSDTYPSLTAIDSNGNSKLLVSKADSANKEYRALDLYTFGKGAVGIGHKFPEELRKMIYKELKPGRILSFDGIDREHQFSIVCTKVENGVRYVQPIHLGEFEHISAKGFMNKEEKPLYMFDSELQAFYNNVKTRVGNVIPRHEDIDCFAQGQINSLISKIKPGKTEVLQYGNERLRVQRSLFGNKLSWYDKNGEKITEDAAKVFIAWCHNAPVITEVTSVNKTLQDNIKTFDFYKEYEQCLISKDYAGAAKIAKDFCIENNKDFAINVSTYETEAEKATATTFCFKAVDGNCEIYKVSYTDNDFSKEISSLKRVDINSFAALCMNKYDNIVNAIYLERQNEYSRQMEKSHLTSDVKETIVNNTAYKETVDIIQDNDIIKASNISNIQDNLNDLIHSYNEFPEKEDDPIIYCEDIGTETYEGVDIADDD